uniref:Fucolectin tachylectin-4 pentraxin-1 domain-containing protein n=1 Tax=Naja naja TaxID=35670 RepID=A0A8C6XUY2_NAJNA
MLITWMWLPLLGLLASHGEAKRCKPGMEATNVARGRPAFQSSTIVSQFNSVARKAVDGNCSGRWIGQNSCTHTKREREPWWYVDLGSQYAISSVVVKSREDCCGERLRGAEIRVGDCVTDHGKSNPLCGTITDTRLGAISTIPCNGLVGRYVTVTVPGCTVSLALCEVEVYGSRVCSQDPCTSGHTQG